MTSSEDELSAEALVRAVFGDEILEDIPSRLRGLAEQWVWERDYSGEDPPCGLNYASSVRIGKAGRKVILEHLGEITSADDAPAWIRTLRNPPWDDMQVMIDAVHAAQQSRFEDASRLQAQAKFDVSVAKQRERLKAERAAKEQLRREEARSTLSVRELIARDSVAALLDSPLPDPLIEGHLDAGSLARLVGEPGDGKTNIAIDIALALASGRPWRGSIPTTRVRVVYVAAEGGRRQFGERVQAGVNRWNGGAMPGPEWFTPIMDRLQILSERFDELIEMFDPELGGEAAGLFVFDTQAKVTEGVDENSNTESAQIERRIAELAERTGAAVLLLHHPAYGTKRGRGASAVTGAMDSEWFVSRDSATGIVTMETTKQKHHPVEAKFLWTIEPQTIETRDGKRSAPVVVPADPIDTMEQQNDADDAAMLAAIVAQPGLARGKYDSENLPPNVGRDAARKALARLESEGRIHSIPGRHGSKLMHPGPSESGASEVFAAAPPEPSSRRKRRRK
ncbi:AAA family ATPase [Rhodococcus sp. 114MFTsu3.1]|uniref:AAA family ATPase n=1 Tax=Rhodococcus sp. 114MFTsu3.1 TaxID=1172184 RepID=UPI000363B458|nr:AAA family ATPase [Rhodococcus sp. 114MFTsu3.1]